MIFRPLFVLADAEALDRAALDRWFGNAWGYDRLPEAVLEYVYAHARRVRDTAYMTVVDAGPMFRERTYATANASAVAWDA